MSSRGGPQKAEGPGQLPPLPPPLIRPWPLAMSASPGRGFGEDIVKLWLPTTLSEIIKLAARRKL